MRLDVVQSFFFYKKCIKSLVLRLNTLRLHSNYCLDHHFLHGNNHVGSICYLSGTYSCCILKKGKRCRTVLFFTYPISFLVSAFVSLRDWVWGWWVLYLAVIVNWITISNLKSTMLAVIVIGLVLTLVALWKMRFDFVQSL